MHPTINLVKKQKEWIFIQRPCFSLKILTSAAPMESVVQRGDVVSLISPKDPDECLLKRVIGLPGDLVKTISYKKKFVTVPDGHVWLEGDNYSCSNDSNQFGCVPLGLIIGKARFIYYPRFSILNNSMPVHRTLRQIEDKTKRDNFYYFIDFKGQNDEDNFDDDDENENE